MLVTESALRKLEALQRRAGHGCIGFRFDGVVGSCRVSKPILKPVRAAVAAAREFRAGDVTLFAAGEMAEILDAATLDYDGVPVFGQGLTVSWPHREGGCPNCR
jgi:hypothetical protein